MPNSTVGGPQLEYLRNRQKRANGKGTLPLAEWLYSGLVLLLWRKVLVRVIPSYVFFFFFW